MPDAGESGKSSGPTATERVLLFMIVSDPGTLDRLITVLLDIGAPGATVIESKGMASIIRDEMPMFAGLAHLLPERTGSRVLLAAMTPAKSDEALSVFEREFKERDRPIALVVPIQRMTGIRD